MTSTWLLMLAITIAANTLLGPYVFAQSVTTWAMDRSRSVNWQGNVGVVGGIPNRTSVVDCVKGSYPGKGTFYLNLTNDDGPAIAACINRLAANQVAYLPAGNYRLNSTLNLSKSNITLRGAGPSQTKLYFYGSGGYAYIAVSGNGKYDPPNFTARWNAGYAKGSNVVTLSTVANLSVGGILALDQADDNRSSVWAAGNEGSQFTRDKNSRHLSQLVSVTGLNATTGEVTINPPLYSDFSSNQSPGAYWWISSASGIGIEDLFIDASHDASPANYTFDFQYAQNIWVKNIESYLSNRAHIHTFRTKSIEIRDSYFHHSRVYGSVSYGAELWNTSCALVENNIFDTLAAPIVLGVGASGNVFGYNYVPTTKYDPSPAWLSQSAAAHGAHAFMNLFEGNVIPNIYLDNTWGSNGNTTVYRNAISGWQTNKIANTFPLVFEAHSRNNNVVGNVLGTRGYHNKYEVHNEPYSGATAIYVLGYWGTSHSNLTNYDPGVYSSLLRHMNFDFASGAVKYCNMEGGPGCQGGSASTMLPDSLYLTVKPAWYGGCSWPPINPVGPVVNNLPAKLRYQGSSCP